jgi:hypothetical protein
LGFNTATCRLIESIISLHTTVSISGKLSTYYKIKLQNAENSKIFRAHPFHLKERGAPRVRSHAEHGNEGRWGPARKPLTVTSSGAAAGSFAGTILGALTRSRAITRTILGTFSGACPIFGTVTFAFSLAGTAAVALPGAAAFATSPTTSATPTIPTAAGQKDIHVVVEEINGHPVGGWG